MLQSLIEKKLLKQLEQIQFGTLTLKMPSGQVHLFEGDQPGPKANLTIYRATVFLRLIRAGDIGFADAYQQGEIDTDDLIALLELILMNQAALQSFYFGTKMIAWMRRLQYFFNKNTLKGSRKNIQMHYDLGNDFYQVWLDASMTYSSGLFTEETKTLYAAQMQKYDRIIDQTEGQANRVLEVGCGWGGFSRRLLEQQSCDFKGITLSEQQHAYANAFDIPSAQYVIEDYRAQSKKYDTVVSIEMFEAVGEHYWQKYFDKLKQVLSQKGRAYIQTITIRPEDFEDYRNSSDFIRSYIFPGGMLPTTPIFIEKAAQAGLKVEDIFCFGQDYAKTLKMWLDNFDQAAGTIKQLGYSKNFIRLWRLYLAACSAAFKVGKTDVMQVRLAHAQ